MSIVILSMAGMSNVCEIIDIQKSIPLNENYRH